MRTLFPVLAVTAACSLPAATAMAQTIPLPTVEKPPPDADLVKSPTDVDLPDVVLNASFFSRYELRENYSNVGLTGGRLGEGDGVAYRARIGLASTPVDIGRDRYALVSFVPQASGFWGEVSGGLTDAELGVHEAKLRLGWSNSWLDVGRFEMVYGEHLVIGNVAWNETGRAFDGARMHMGLDSGSYVDVFASQVAEGRGVGAIEPFGSGDTYFLGVYAGWGPSLAEGLELDTYGLVLLQPEVSEGPMEMLDDDTSAEITLGTRAKYKLGRVTVRGEAGVQLGESIRTDTTTTAYQVDADAMVAVIDGVKAGLGGQYASGDDPTTMKNEGWNQLFPTAHKFLGFTDVIGGRTNVGSVYARARWKPLSDLSFAADQHVFFRPETTGGADAYVGTETNLWSVWKIGKGLGLRTQYCALLASEDGPLGVDAVVHYVEVQLRLDM